MFGGSSKRIIKVVAIFANDSVFDKLIYWYFQFFAQQAGSAAEIFTRFIIYQFGFEGLFDPDREKVTTYWFFPAYFSIVEGLLNSTFYNWFGIIKR